MAEAGAGEGGFSWSLKRRILRKVTLVLPGLPEAQLSPNAAALSPLAWPTTLTTESVICACEIAGRIKPKSRPRFGGKGYAYNVAGLKEAEQAIGWQLKEQMLGRDALSDARIGIRIVLFTRQKSGDVDNIAKTILDAANGIVWGDDRQVHELMVRREYVEHEPERACIVIYSIDGLSRRHLTCKTCGKKFVSHDPERQFCSKQCYGDERKLRVEMECAQCGKSIVIRATDQRRYVRHFCSIACRALGRRKPATG